MKKRIRGEKKQKRSDKSPADFPGMLIKYLQSSAGKRISRKSIYKKFNRSFSKEEMALAIKELEQEGRLMVEGSKVFLPALGKSSKKGPRVYEGVVDMTKHGYAFVHVEGLEHDIFVSSPRLNRALHGDTVKVAVIKSRPNGKMDGEVVGIVKRANDRFLGTVHVSPNYAFLIPDRRNMLHDIYIPLNKLHNAKDGDKAIALITHWPIESKSPVGEIVEVLGKSGSNDIEMKSILIENGFPLAFSEAALKQAAAISDQISSKEISRRRDMRGVPTFTIDPDDAKDFDDALSIQSLPDGNLEIGVHIADVSYYVTPGSPLDRDARERGTSVYLVDRVLPMLPEKLSNQVCSLRPDEDKLCFSVLFTMTPNAKVSEVWFGRTVIRSQKRFTYKEAQAVLDTGKGPFARQLLQLNTIARKLRQERIANGSIPFETVEIKIRLDEKGHPLEVMTKELTEANWLIEDFMLLANRYVAKYVSKLRHGRQPVPFVYRVHDKPDMVKLEQFAQFARNFGYHIKFTDPEEVADQLNRFLKRIRGKKEQNVLEQIAIRSMAKAIYTTHNIGHFGLAFDYYTHFTSPIRRYPDILVHRILQQCLTDGEILYPRDELEQICDHCSQRERAAMEAERESIKYKQVEFMQDKVGMEYEGIISGVVYKGIFVELTETRCEGFVHVRHLGEGDFLFDESNYCLVDQESGITFRLGDNIRVRVLETNLENRTIDLAPAAES
ncbi:MAG: ribonuclease R [Chitinophagales bacterium]|nr:MAG: ribonuclease R [Chitinophagales bacterium]